MGRFFYTYKLHRVRIIFFLLLLLVNGSAWADDNCPTLSEKTLELCNPTKDEVADALTAPVVIINGVRTEGTPSPDNDEFFESIKDQIYTFKWNFKDANDNTVASGCPQNFKLTDTEAPTCGASSLTVHGWGAYVDQATFSSAVENQKPTWLDNCSSQDEINVDFNVPELNNLGRWNGSTTTISYTLTDKYGNINSVCSQTIKFSANEKLECPYIAPVSLDAKDCSLKCSEIATGIRSTLDYRGTPSMDGLNRTIPPDEENDLIKIFDETKSIVNSNCSKNYSPGQYSFYLHYSPTVNHQYCSVQVNVKDNSNPPVCPGFGDIVIEKSSVSSTEISNLLTTKVLNYGPALDNCTPNSNLLVEYRGGDVSGSCQEISYILSDYGSQRTCHANIVLLKCPDMPTLEKKFCNYSEDKMPKSDLVDFLNLNVPSLDYCSEKILGIYEQSSLKNNYKDGESQNVSWKFSVNGMTKTCKQTIKIKRDNNASCPDNEITLEAEKECKVNGSRIPEPIVNSCSSYEVWWGTENSDNGRYQHSFSDLKNYSFADGESIYWGIKWNAKCSTKINVVDNSAPTCLSPSLGTLTGKCIFDRSDVESMFDAVDLSKKGDDNCGIQSSSIDWDYTAYTSFSFAEDGSERTYPIYYKLKDNSGIESADYCMATITVKVDNNVTCPETSMAFLTDNTSVPITLDGKAEWTLSAKSPSTITYSSNSLSNLSFSQNNTVEFSAKVCNKVVRTCSSTIRLIKPTTPCSTE